MLRVTVFTKEVIETSIVPPLLPLLTLVFDAAAAGFVPIPEIGVKVIIGEAVRPKHLFHSLILFVVCQYHI
jgi:hypothetical protein